MQAARGYGDAGKCRSREGGQGRDLGSSGGMGFPGESGAEWLSGGALEEVTGVPLAGPGAGGVNRWRVSGEYEPRQFGGSFCGGVAEVAAAVAGAVVVAVAGSNDIK